MVAVEETERAWRAALRREETLEQELKELVWRVGLLIRSLYGDASPIVRDFGLKPAARRKPSPGTLVVAIEKRRATRAMRRTMSRKQRKAIKGSR